MDRSAATIASAAADLPAACGEGCRFAEPLHGDYEDWVWCEHPAASNRVRRVGSSCPVFPLSPNGRLAAALLAATSPVPAPADRLGPP